MNAIPKSIAHRLALPILLLFGLLTNGLFAQEPLSVGQRLKLSDANQNFRTGYFLEAKKGYEALLLEVQDRPEINFMAGKSAFNLRRYQEAMAFFGQADFTGKEVPEDYHLYLGKALFITYQIDSAKSHFTLALQGLDEKEKAESDASLYLSYITNREAFMQNPEKVTLSPISQVNTPGHESSSCLSLDGKTLFFTSSRKENTGAGKDEAFDMYFQDIWYATWDSSSQAWSEPALLPGDVNTPEHDASLGINPQGDLLFVYKSEQGGNIYYTRRKRTGEYREPKPMEGQVNTSYFESGASMSADRKKLYIISEREKRGAQGSGDIWILHKDSKYAYDQQENPGSPLNSIYDENSVFIHPDGKTLFFSSNRAESMGGYDIFMSRKVGGKWLPPVNLGYPINSSGDEVYFSVSPDGNKAWVSSRRPESLGGSYDIYEIDLREYVFPLDRKNEGPQKPTVCMIQGKVLSKATAEPLEIELELFSANGKLIERFETGENGTYLLTVEGNQDYVLKATVPGFKPAEESFRVERLEGKTNAVTKVFLLETQ
jgi:hypothetical protein